MSGDEEDDRLKEQSTFNEPVNVYTKDEGLGKIEVSTAEIDTIAERLSSEEASLETILPFQMRS